jgi:hypothetical protein
MNCLLLDSSTVNNPISFFEELYDKGHGPKFRKLFFQEDERNCEFPNEINEKKDYIIKRDSWYDDEGNYHQEEEKVIFTEALTTDLLAEFKISKGLLSKHVINLPTPDSVLVFLKDVLGSIDYFSKRADVLEFAVKYPIYIKPLQSLKDFIYSRYGKPYPEILGEIIPISKNGQPAPDVEDQAGKCRAFQWLGDPPYAYTLRLYHELTATRKIIKCENEISFAEVFDNEEHVTARKIRWLPRHGEVDTNKAFLINLFQAMMNNGLIQSVTNRELKEKLIFFFSDRHGNKFKADNFSSSFSQSKKNQSKSTPKKDLIIDDIITKLSQLKEDKLASPQI